MPKIENVVVWGKGRLKPFPAILHCFDQVPKCNLQVCGLIRAGRCGFVGGSVSLRVDIEVSKAHDGPKYVISHPPSLLQS